MSRTLHLSIGPVQDFIRQARRTRDLWAGSFLLSWLSGVAMKAVTDRNGEILFPRVIDERREPIDPLFRALHGLPPLDGTSWPVVGTLPNRFKATLPDGVDAVEIAGAVRRAWTNLARHVWKTFLQQAAQDFGTDSAEIWDRQIAGFWQIAWAVEPDDSSKDLLSPRKHWRTVALPRDEPGDHCSIMGDWQELSGHVRAKGQRKPQDEYWDAVRKAVNSVVYRSARPKGVIEIRATERLCAIALVKRLFPLLPLNRFERPTDDLEPAVGWIPGRPTDWITIDDARDFELRCRLRKAPSTAYMAAVPWMLHAWSAKPDACNGFASNVERIWPDAAPGILRNAERFSAIKGLVGTAFGHLDGPLLFTDGIARRRAEMRDNRAADTDQTADGSAVAELTKALETLRTITAPKGGRRQEKMREASPFYALLLMDGDNMGVRLSKDPDGTSAALATFTKQVPGIVRDADGLPIYAGGDDVLALLPIHTAIATAHELSLKFRASFPSGATISAGLVFAHFSHPLGAVLETAHTALDDVAKTANDRDSLAIVVVKGGAGAVRERTGRPGGSEAVSAPRKHDGAAAEWVSTWELGGGASAAETLQDLVEKFAKDDERSSSFLHNLADRYGDLLGQFTTEQLGKDLARLLLAERLKGQDLLAIDDLERRNAVLAGVRTEMEELAAVCLPRHATGTIRFDLDGALVVKFLADNGGWYKGTACDR